MAASSRAVLASREDCEGSASRSSLACTSELVRGQGAAGLAHGLADLGAEHLAQVVCSSGAQG